ncbi:MAG: FtsX-like permease family protein [Bacillus sp. (in: firmicutes)]
MKKRILWKDIFHAITRSLGRFLAIFSLMALGVFAFVGLKVTGPDMRSTAEVFFSENHLADLSVISSYGLDKSDQKIIESADQLAHVEYGYMKDVVIKDTAESIRIFSVPDTLSQYEVVSGSLPKNSDEIALDYLYKGDYEIGDTITFTEEKDAEGNQMLQKHRFRVAGFVKSSELVDKNNIGQTTVGTGKLHGYAVVTENTFASDVYMIARLSFLDTENLDAYSDEYSELARKHKAELKTLLQDQPAKRLKSLKEEKQAEIDEGWKEINDAKQQIAKNQAQLDDAKHQIVDAKAKVAENQGKLDSEVSDAQALIDDGQQQLNDAQSSITAAESQLKDATAQLSSGQATLDEKWVQLQSTKSQLDAAKQVLDETNRKLASAAEAIQNGKTQLEDAQQQVARNRQSLVSAQNEINENQKKLDIQKTELADKQAELNAQQASLEKAKSDAKQAQNEIDRKQAELNAKETELANGKSGYEVGIVELESALSSGKEQLKGLNGQQAALTETLRRLETDKAAAEQAGNLAKAEEIKTEIAGVQTRLDQVTAGIADTEQGVKEAGNRLAAVQAEHQSFIKNTYSPGMAMIEAVRPELDAKQAQVDASNQQIKASQTKIDDAKAKIDAGNQQIKAGQAKIDDAQAQVDAGTRQLHDAKAELTRQEKLLASKEKHYEAGLEAYNLGVVEYNKNLQTYYSGLAKWTEGVEALRKNTAEYESNVDRLAQAKAELAAKQNDLAEAKNELAQKQSEGQQQIDDTNAQIASKENEYNEKLKEFEDEKSKAETEIATNESDLKNAEEKLNDLALPVYTVGDRKDNPGYKNYLNNSQRIDVLSDVFPVFLFAIAALVSLTTMTRFVEEERINMGTFKALGYSNRDIQKKFLVYGLVSCTLGSAVGAILGHTLLPVIIFNAYAATSTFSQLELHFAPFYTLIAFLIAIICTVLSAHLVATKELREKPAQLLLPKPPKVGSRILLERITPIWNRMSFTYKVTARNLFRYKKRMFMTIFGVAGCSALLITGFGLKNSLSGIVDRQFGDIVKYDLIVVNNDNPDSSEIQELNSLLHGEAIRKSTSGHYEELTTIAGDHNDTQSITLLVPENEEAFRDFVKLQNRESGRELRVNDDGIIISERLADLLDASLGDTIKLTDSDDRPRKMRITGITEMYIGHYAFMNKTEYAKVFGKDMTVDTSLVALKDRSASSIEKSAADFIDLSGVKGVQQNFQVRTQINAVMKGLDKVILVLIIVSVLLATVVIYNLTNINVSERIRELSTIKVLGFYDKEVTMYIYRETIILSILGILAGYVVGYFLHMFIIDSLPPDDAMFSPDLWLSNLGLSAGISLLITFAIMIVMHYRMKHINMLDALKSVE